MGHLPPTTHSSVVYVAPPKDRQTWWIKIMDTNPIKLSLKGHLKIEISIHS